MSDLLMIRANSLQKIVIHITSYKKATMSDSFRSLLKKTKERIVRFFRVNCSFALLLTKKEQFAQRTEERIPNPDYN